MMKQVLSVSDVMAKKLHTLRKYTPILDAFEDVDFDHEQLDESEIEALFEAAFTDETEAASDTLDAWVDANCSA